MRLADFANKIFNGENRFRAKEFSEIGSIENFCAALERERCRADRSGMPFALITFEAKNGSSNGEYSDYLAKAICTRMRTTDKVGWIDYNHIGLILYNSGREEALCLVGDIQKALSDKIPIPDCCIYIYPPDRQDSGVSKGNGPGNKVADISKLKTNSNKKSEKFIKRTGDNSVILNPQSSSIPSDDCQLPVQDLQCPFANKIPVWKRLMDIFGATFGLIIFSPVFLIISVLIKIVSPGPIFFKQERIGVSGKRFKMWKFRTMEIDADTTVHKRYVKELYKNDSTLQKLENDRRIIPFGEILRKTCLDELPQFINVLLGEMSLVGPRPDVDYAVKEYECWHFARLDVVPGMTGLWQVSGKNRTTFRKMVSLDVNYKRRPSVWNDLKILVLTLPAILSEIKNPDTNETSIYMANKRAKSYKHIVN